MYLLSLGQHAAIVALFHFIFALMIGGKLRFLVKPWLILLGQISYSLYLLHQYIGLCMIRYLVSVKAVPVWAAILTATACMIGMAYWVTIYIEVPIVKLFRSSLRKPIMKHPGKLPKLSMRKIKTRVGGMV